jgi:hypothetical protein
MAEAEVRMHINFADANAEAEAWRQEQENRRVNVGASTFGGTGFGGNTTNVNFSQTAQFSSVTNQVNQAFSQLNATLNQLSQTINQVNNATQQFNSNTANNTSNNVNNITNNYGGGGGGGGGGPSPGAGGLGSFFTRGSLGRIASFGFILRESQRIFEDTSQYNERLALAQSDQAKQVEATMEYRRNLLSVPFAGTLVQLASDPLGRGAAAINLTLDQAKQQDALNYTRQENRRFTEATIRRATELSSPIEYRREMGRVNIGEEEQRQNLEERRRQESQQISEYFANQRAAVEQHYEELTHGPGHVLVGREMTQAELDERRGFLEAVGKSEQQRQAQLTRQFDTAITANTTLSNAERERVRGGRQLMLARPGWETEVYELRARGLDQEADRRSQQRQFEADLMEHPGDTDYQAELRRAFAAQSAFTQYRQNRENAVTQTGIETATRASQQRAAQEPFEAGLTEILGQNTVRTLHALPRDQMRVAMQNASAIFEYLADFTRTVQRTNLENYGQAGIAGALLNRDPREAGLLRIRLQRDLELSQAPQGIAGLLVRGGITARFGQAEALFTRQFDEERALQTQGLRLGLEEATLQAQGREKSAQALRIQNDTIQAAQALRNQGRDEDAALVEKTGLQNLMAYRLDLSRNPSAIARAFEPGTLGQGYNLGSIAGTRENQQQAIQYTNDLINRGFGPGATTGGATPTTPSGAPGTAPPGLTPFGPGPGGTWPKGWNLPMGGGVIPQNLPELTSSINPLGLFGTTSTVTGMSLGQQEAVSPRASMEVMSGALRPGGVGGSSQEPPVTRQQGEDIKGLISTLVDLIR